MEINDEVREIQHAIFPEKRISILFGCSVLRSRTLTGEETVASYAMPNAELRMQNFSAYGGSKGFLDYARNDMLH